MFPILVIAIGIAVLLFGKRLAVLGAAVGALLGVGVLSLFPSSFPPLAILLIPGLLAVLGGHVRRVRKRDREHCSHGVGCARGCGNRAGIPGSL